MLDVIVADTEVFPKYFLLVAKTLVDGQTHILENRDDIVAFYNQHKDAIWCFYNSGYDQYIIKVRLHRTPWLSGLSVLI